MKEATFEPTRNADVIDSAVTLLGAEVIDDRP